MKVVCAKELRMEELCGRARDKVVRVMHDRVERERVVCVCVCGRILYDKVLCERVSASRIQNWTGAVSRKVT